MEERVNGKTNKKMEMDIMKEKKEKIMKNIRKKDS